MTAKDSITDYNCPQSIVKILFFPLIQQNIFTLYDIRRSCSTSIFKQMTCHYQLALSHDVHMASLVDFTCTCLVTFYFWASHFGASNLVMYSKQSESISGDKGLHFLREYVKVFCVICKHNFSNFLIPEKCIILDYFLYQFTSAILCICIWRKMAKLS